MGEELGVIWLLAIGLGLACIFGFIAQKLRQSSIIGYLIAGYIIGPNSPGFVADAYISEQLASIGITLLMFAVGLNFHWNDLLAVRKIALPGALVLSTLSITAGTFYSVFRGESWMTGFVIGLAICVSSTVVIVRVLSDQGLLHTKQGHIVVGWTIVEDLISIFGLLLLPALASTTTTTDHSILNLLYQIGWVLLKIFMLALFIYFMGSKLIETLLKTVSRTRSHELFTLAILASTFLIAIFSSYIFGVSLALGAFIAGTIVGQTDMSHQAAANALPMRDTFAVIFFLSVGMLFNPAAVMSDLPLFFGILTILLLLRPFFAFLIVKIAKYPIVVCLTVALAIAQIGEYSFILAEEGSKLGILPDKAFDILVASSFITIGLNPILFELFEPLCKRYVGMPDTAATQSKTHAQALHTFSHNPLSLLPRAIVVGFGPIGQEVAEHLLDQDYHVLIIDCNIDTVSSIKKEKEIEILYGDASQFHILEKAHIKEAKLLIITTPDFSMAKSIIQTSRHLNSSIKIIARSHFKFDILNNHLDEIPTICDEEASSEKFIAAINQYLEQ